MSASLPEGQSACCASILVVDDEPDLADLFRQHFRREIRRGDYVLHFAVSGEQAFERLAGKIEPHLIVIVSDIEMPRTDGLTLLRQIKQRVPNLPVILMTEFGGEERRRRAAEYGAAEFITKPVDFDHLKAQLLQFSIVSAPEAPH
jgi:CheY-like chemotaxis protein